MRGGPGNGLPLCIITAGYRRAKLVSGAFFFSARFTSPRTGASAFRGTPASLKEVVLSMQARISSSATEASPAGGRGTPCTWRDPLRARMERGRWRRSPGHLEDDLESSSGADAADQFQVQRTAGAHLPRGVEELLRGGEADRVHEPHEAAGR